MKNNRSMSQRNPSASAPCSLCSLWCGIKGIKHSGVLLLQEMNQWRCGVLKQRHCYHPQVDYFPIRAWPQVFYSSKGSCPAGAFFFSFFFLVLAASIFCTNPMNFSAHSTPRSCHENVLGIRLLFPLCSGRFEWKKNFWNTAEPVNTASPSPTNRNQEGAGLTIATMKWKDPHAVLAPVSGSVLAAFLHTLSPEPRLLISFHHFS